MRALSDRDVDAVGLDVRPSEWTRVVGSVADAGLVREVTSGVDIDAVATMVARGGSVRTPLSQVIGSKEYAGSSYHLGQFAPPAG